MKKTICPRCKYKNNGEDKYCENCLANLVTAVGVGYYERYMTE